MCASIERGSGQGCWEATPRWGWASQRGWGRARWARTLICLPGCPVVCPCCQWRVTHAHPSSPTHTHRNPTPHARSAGAVLADPGAHQGAPGGGRHPL